MPNYISSNDGNWGDSSTWGGTGVPGDGDTAVIGHTVTVDQDTIIGTSPSDTTTDVVAITGNGLLIVDTDISFIIRGNVLGDVGASNNTKDCMVVNAGGAIIFDATQAATPTTKYTMEFGQYATLSTNGTPEKRCYLGANNGSGRMDLTTTIYERGACFTSDYTDFQNIGRFLQRSSGSVNPRKISIKNSTFTNTTVSLGSRTINGQIVFEHNIIDDTAIIIFKGVADTTALSDIKNNIFNAHVVFNPPAGYSITGNYFGGSFATNAVALSTQRAATISNNIDISKSGATVIDSDFSGNIIFRDVNDDNPTAHLIHASSADNNFESNVIDYSGKGYQGDFIFPKSANGFKNIIKKNILLPQSGGKSGGKLFSDAFMNTDTVCTVENNTVVTCSVGGTQPETAFGIGESVNAYAGYCDSFKNNIAWTYPDIGLTGGWLLGRQQSNITDIITISDYNLGWGLSAGSEGAGYNAWDDYKTNPVLSYTPDVNGLGIDVDPLFVDYTRNVATYDIAGLGNDAETTWATGQSYVVGDMVSAQDSGFYFDTVINFRCIKDHSSLAGDATNGKPGLATNYRDNWELTTLYRLREDTARIATLLTWIKEGFSPRNQALKGAGFDGLDIGAVAVAVVQVASGGGLLLRSIVAAGMSLSGLKMRKIN